MNIIFYKFCSAPSNTQQTQDTKLIILDDVRPEEHACTFGSVTRFAQVFVICFALNNTASLEAAVQFVHQISSNKECDCSCFGGNKKRFKMQHYKTRCGISHAVLVSLF